MQFQFQARDNLRFCFLVSDKLEPYMIIVALSPAHGKLLRLTKRQIDDCYTAIVAFKQRFGVDNESYHYTPCAEREQADAAVAAGMSREAKAHSTHWHLKMRIATGMYKQQFPILQLLDFDHLRARSGVLGVYFLNVNFYSILGCFPPVAATTSDTIMPGKPCRGSRSRD